MDAMMNSTLTYDQIKSTCVIMNITAVKNLFINDLVFITFTSSQGTNGLADIWVLPDEGKKVIQLQALSQLLQHRLQPQHCMLYNGTGKADRKSIGINVILKKFYCTNRNTYPCTPNNRLLVLH